MWKNLSVFMVVFFAACSDDPATKKGITPVQDVTVGLEVSAGDHVTGEVGCNPRMETNSCEPRPGDVSDTVSSEVFVDVRRDSDNVGPEADAVAEVTIVTCQNNGGCDDNDSCTTDACADGVCTHDLIANCCATHADCDDNDPCTIGVCDKAQCVFSTKNNCCHESVDCSPPDGCHTMECQNNECLAVSIPGCCLKDTDCDDNKPCTADYCNSEGWCSTLPKCPLDCDVATGACTDKMCTVPTDCTGGACSCQTNPDGSTYVSCVELIDCVTGICTYNENKEQCEFGCDVALRSCLPPQCYEQQDFMCDDGDPCTQDTCELTMWCTHTPIDDCCTATKPCDDGNLCTIDVCKPDNMCLFVDACPGQVCDAGTCHTGNCVTNADCTTPVECHCESTAAVCTSMTGVCLNYQCETTQAVEVCSTACTAGICQSACISDAACADLDLCTTDTCEAGVCKHTVQAGCCVTVENCNDGDLCTTEQCYDHVCVSEPKCPFVCEASTGTCVAPECTVDGDCNDGNVCTADFCISTACVNQLSPGCCQVTADCDDGLPCTVDTCTAQHTCSHANNPACCTDASTCADSDPCTEDLCINNVCEHVTKTTCCSQASECVLPGMDPCEQAFCISGQCKYSPKVGCCHNDGECGDGNTCNMDQCYKNACYYEDGCETLGNGFLCDQGVTCTSHACTTDDDCYPASGGCRCDGARVVCLGRNGGIGSCDVATGKCKESVTVTDCTTGGFTYCNGGVCK